MSSPQEFLSLVMYFMQGTGLMPIIVGALGAMTTIFILKYLFGRG